MHKFSPLLFLNQLFNASSAGGILLISCVVFSLLITNSPLGHHFESLLTTFIGFETPHVKLRYELISWINDGLMAIFFLLAGLEIKREILQGQLSTVKQASLPVFAAAGGMIVPALIYFLINKGTATAAGWGIPMATDIAFAVALISALGKRVPASLKIFLTALAIVDDLGAILVIAFFYTTSVQTAYLLYAGILFLAMLLLNAFGLKNKWFYLLPGLLLWYFIHHSGIHATIAGVLTALCIPMGNQPKTSPLIQVEHALNKPVTFLILPVFALANTDIHLESNMLQSLGSKSSLGIIFGLFIGKPLGIVLLSWISVVFKISILPKGASWLHLVGLGLLAGIGFTMSVFVALLSFEQPQLQSEAKFAILIASILSALGGYYFLNTLNKLPLRQKQNEAA
jgi:NhaA family Na+:H+ antiporter